MRKTITQKEVNKLLIFQEKAQLLQEESVKIDTDIQKMLGTKDEHGYILYFLTEGQDVMDFLRNCGVKLK